MSLNKKQVVLLILVVSVVAILFIKGYKSSTSSVNTTPSANSAFDINTYVEQEKKELSQPLQVRISELEKEVKNPIVLQQLIVLWDSLNNQLVSAYFMEQYANIEPTEKNWYATGSKYYTFASLSNDSIIISEAASKAKKAFEKYKNKF